MWGEDIILVEPTLRQKAVARAMNYLEAYYISRDELLQLATRFPVAAKKIRNAAIKVRARPSLRQANGR